ncbi:group I truncated hemoglobin [Marinobacterium arenosum]|uniref:group I truncated hemoglobin n=1 Tax=Marinobacterium arenosum TaxID=2862496 RepID=UPI001C97776C|nr:group 1 truncated hemoglobin [Marinobacterium arenosum]MBY4677291.1 group 1 truncated hemoglobin [Marinobacterium arenosum]
MIRCNRSLLAAAVLTLLCLPGMSQIARAQDDASQVQPTLYQRLGGLMPISVVVSDFIDALVPDPMLNANPAIDEARQQVPAAYLKYHVTALVCQVTAGPCQYHGRTMKESHSHLQITDSEWQRMVVIFTETLARHQVPERETAELLEIIESTRADIVMPMESGG